MKFRYDANEIIFANKIIIKSHLFTIVFSEFHGAKIAINKSREEN